VKELESKLRKLPLVGPPSELDERVLAQKPERPLQPFPERRRVPLWVTVAVGIITATAGFAAGRVWRSPRPVVRHDRPQPIVVQVIYDSPTSRNPFDFTTASHFFPARKLEIKMREFNTTI
jgi:hypothetical protein